jgi:putative Mn2+ efflux pump MntP
MQLIILGLVVGANNLAAALALGTLGVKERQWRIILIFGTVEFFVPLFGIWLGRQAIRYVEQNAQLIAPLLLAGLGLWTLWTGLRHAPNREEIGRWLTRPGGVLLLALGLSADNVVVGFSLGLIGTEPLLVAAVIAAFSMTFTWLGIQLGAITRRHWERYAEIAAGLLLLGLALSAWLGWL